MSNGDQTLWGKTLITLLNKAGGAGVQVTTYTQTASDIEDGIGDCAKAGQASGNLDTLIMLGVKNEETAAILSDQLPKVRVHTKVVESLTTDYNDPDTPVDFIAHA